MKRQLTKEEMGIAGKMLVSRKEELEFFEYQMNYYKLMLDSGLEINYKKTIRDFKEKAKEFKEQRDMTAEIIKTLQLQMREGVEVKEEVDEAKEEVKKEVDE